MANMIMTKTAMPEQQPDVRNKNFEEVALGYTEEMAIFEAQRCLHCKNRPCVNGCPVNVPIPEFIAHIANGEFEQAYTVLTSANSLPAICGRVCPQETQCESKCVRGIKGEPVAIGRLERFVADYHMAHSKEKLQRAKSNGHKVAVVGAGPSGLTCAGDLAKAGYAVTVFEAFHTAGGVLMYGIPEFRLPKAIVQKEIDGLRALGVEIQTNMVIGKVLSVDELFEMGYEAVFIGTGAGLPNFMDIPGNGLSGVYSANEFLTRINLMKAYLDDYDTCIIYRRSEEEMPARNEEIHHAKEEGIEFCLLTNPVAILDDGTGKVGKIECVKMELGQPDESGRRRPIEKKGSNFQMDVDCVVVAIGNSPNPLIRITTKGIEANKRGCLVVDESTMQTTRQGVYAGGDAVTGAATVILAMGAGRQAARSIDAYIQGKND